MNNEKINLWTASSPPMPNTGIAVNFERIPQAVAFKLHVILPSPGLYVDLANPFSPAGQRFFSNPFACIFYFI